MYVLNYRRSALTNTRLLGSLCLAFALFSFSSCTKEQNTITPGNTAPQEAQEQDPINYRISHLKSGEVVAVTYYDDGSRSLAEQVDLAELYPGMDLSPIQEQSPGETSGRRSNSNGGIGPGGGPTGPKVPKCCSLFNLEAVSAPNQQLRDGVAFERGEANLGNPQLITNIEWFYQLKILDIPSNQPAFSSQVFRDYHVGASCANPVRTVIYYDLPDGNCGDLFTAQVSRWYVGNLPFDLGPSVYNCRRESIMVRTTYENGVNCN